MSLMNSQFKKIKSSTLIYRSLYKFGKTNIIHKEDTISFEQKIIMMRSK